MSAQVHGASQRETDDRPRQLLRARLDERLLAAEQYFGANAAAIARCASDMADGFFDGGTLFIMGSGASATDAQHNSVEYVHPVLPGCRALPALSLSNDTAVVTAAFEGVAAADVYARQLRVLGRRGDMALAFATVPMPSPVTHALAEAERSGMLTIALLAGAARAPVASAAHQLHAVSDDPLITQELHLATYHMLWELVHIVLNHRGIARGRP